MQEENKAPERDLLSELDRVTETKTPGAEGQNKPWGWGEDEVPIEPKTPGTTKTQPPANPGNPNQKLTEAQIKSAAVASAAGVEFITSLVTEGIINLRYFHKFNEDERQKLDEYILDSAPEKLTEDEKQLSNRYNRLMDRRDKKIEKVTMSDKSRKRMEDAFEAYTVATGKVFLTPQTQLGLSVGESVVKAIIAAFID